MSTPTPTTASTLGERIDEVSERIARAERESGRPEGSVRLVAVSKSVGRAEIDAAYAAGLREFGENRVQDAREKFASYIPNDLVLHLIGSLQTNKVKFVVGAFDLVHSLDRESLASALDDRARTAGAAQPVLIQVNIAREQQKHGCLPEDVPGLIEQVLAKPSLELRGFMTMAPLVATADDARPVFEGLRELRDRLQLQYPEANLGELSMGMTNDYLSAIEEGATIVRVGRAIFGERTSA